jgi:hypothetical protein
LPSFLAHDASHRGGIAINTLWFGAAIGTTGFLWVTSEPVSDAREDTRVTLNLSIFRCTMLCHVALVGLVGLQPGQGAAVRLLSRRALVIRRHCLVRLGCRRLLGLLSLLLLWVLLPLYR